MLQIQIGDTLVCDTCMRYLYVIRVWDTGMRYVYEILVCDTCMTYWYVIPVCDTGMRYVYEILVCDTCMRYWYEIREWDTCMQYVYEILVCDTCIRYIGMRYHYVILGGISLRDTSMRISVVNSNSNPKFLNSIPKVFEYNSNLDRMCVFHTTSKKIFLSPFDQNLEECRKIIPTEIRK